MKQNTSAGSAWASFHCIFNTHKIFFLRKYKNVMMMREIFEAEILFLISPVRPVG